MRFYYKIITLSVILAFFFTGCVTVGPEEWVISQNFSKWKEQNRLETLQELGIELALNPSYLAEKKNQISYLLEQRLKSLLAEDPSPMVRVFALESLSLMVGVQGQNTYIQALQDSAFIVRYTALKKLYQFGDFRATSALLKVLKHDLSPQCRREAARILAKIGSPAVIKELIQIWSQEENLSVQYHLYQSLQKISGVHLPFYEEEWKWWWEQKKKKTQSQKDKG
ncbi:MAG: HEAT repeat domain-containing protein [Planctomycetota bacterium]|nr:MAG: HEAT repeat domain-containing protein [Planctomycetota bacterium]